MLNVMLFVSTLWSVWLCAIAKDLSSSKDAAAANEERYSAEISTVSPLGKSLRAMILLPLHLWISQCLYVRLVIEFF